ncbi:MAG: type II toxin-antitoxin system VapC family toxin [Pseudomonadota bacterium]
MVTHLFDTHICIFLLNQRGGHEHIVRRMDGMLRGQIGISAISVAELAFGVAASRRQIDNLGRLERFFAEFELLPFDHAAAHPYGSLRYHLQAQGTPIGALDLLIAAHTLSLDATLVTHNTREFARVPGLKLEDWTTHTDPRKPPWP